MSEEERRRKIILDSAAAVIRAMECMRNSMLLARGGAATTDGQVDTFRGAAEALARQAAALERHCTDGGYGSTSEGAPGGRGNPAASGTPDEGA